jgi:NADPH-dependent FMN reductase
LTEGLPPEDNLIAPGAGGIVKAVFFKGTPPAGRDPLCNRASAAIMAVTKARGWDTKTFALAGMDIGACRGCFSCWAKTPGRCVIQDGEEAIVRAAAATDRLIWLTPVTFGGYSPELKKAVDRIIPIILPFFTKVRGETHHPLRYLHRYRLLVIGTQPQKDDDSEGVFRRLVGRNALNLGDADATALVFSGDVSLAEMEKRLGNEPFFVGEAR